MLKGMGSGDRDEAQGHGIRACSQGVSDQWCDDLIGDEGASAICGDTGLQLLEPVEELSKGTRSASSSSRTTLRGHKEAASA